jgi:DNA-binding response OmpR family regulator
MTRSPINRPPLQLRVLLVEDHQQLAKTVRDGLARRGCRVSTASTLARAREAIAQYEFDLAILDLMLPDGSSRTLIPTLRGDSSNPVIIVLTGFLDAQTAVALANEADLTIPKPTDVNTLLKAIDRVTGNARLRFITRAYSDHAGLSPREEEAVWGAVRGLNADEVAAEMGVTAGTLRTFWSRVLNKTGQGSQRDVIGAVLRFNCRAD